MEKSQEATEFQTFERCPHDKENPYSMTSNALIRDSSISPNCRWMLIYMLANKEGWKIRVPQIIAHVKPFVGREKVYKVINEAIDAGYIKKQECFRPNPRGGRLKGFIYIVSELPKFKKCYRHPDSQDAGDQHVGKQDTNKEPSVKKDYPVKKQQQAAPAAAVFSCIQEEKRISQKEWKHLMKFPEEEVDKAIKYTQQADKAGIIETSFIQYLKWILKEKPDLKQVVDIQANKDLAKHCENVGISPTYSLEALSKSVIISPITGQSESFEFFYDKPNFREKLLERMGKCMFKNRKEEA